MRRSTSRRSSAATRSTERRGWTFESNRSPAIRTTSTEFGERDVDGPDERGELPLPLRDGRLAQIRVTRAQVDVCRVEQSKHPVRRGLL